MDKDIAFVKIFTGGEIAVRKLKAQLEDQDIESSVRIVQDGLTAYGATSHTTLHLLIRKKDLTKAQPIIEEFEETAQH